MRKLLGPARHDADLQDISISYPAEYENNSDENYYGKQNVEQEKNPLLGVFSTICKHWFLILFINLLVTALTIVYVAQKRDFYTASARVQVNAEMNPAADSRSGTSSIVVSSGGGDPAYFTTQLQIMEGAGMTRRVIKTLDIENNEDFLNPQNGRNLTVWQNVKKMFGFYRPPDNPPVETAFKPAVKKALNLKNENAADPDAETERLAPFVSKLKRNLNIAPVKDTRTNNRETRLIEIEYTNEDPRVAQKVVNTIADTYVQQNLERKVMSNASAGDFLQKRVGDLQSEIRQGEERLINYAKSNQIVSLDSDQNTVVRRFSDLNMKLGQAENDRVAAQTALQAATQNPLRTVTTESKDSQVIALESRLNEQKQRLAQLKTEFTDEWFEVVQTRKSIEGLETQLAGIAKRASDVQLATLQQNLNESVAREKELRANFETQRAEVMRQNEAAINYKIIQQEIDTNKTLLDSLLQRSRENDVILNGTPNNVLVLDRALLPRSPVGPERMKVVGMAFLVSLFAGVGLAFAIDWMNGSIKVADNVETLIGLPLLAAIPSAPAGLTRRIFPSGLSFSRRKRLQKRYHLSDFERPEFAEAYLQLRTYLMLSTPGGAPQTILVTSAEESEGKTVTALNLAQTLAATGEKILLIDADLRCPRIHNIKELPNNCGLTNLLASKSIDEELLEKSVVRISEDSSLYILTSGERTAQPANLLASREMRALLVKLSQHYSYIVIDSPPVLYFADSAILSAICDAVVVVVRENISSKQTVLKAKKMLQNVGATIVGIVLNGVPLQWSNYTKYKRYSMIDDISSNDGQSVLNLN